MDEREKQGVAAVGLLAAYADGAEVERERGEIQRQFEKLAGEDASLGAAWRDVTLERASLEQIARGLSPESKSLAYEMAVCVCDADGARTESEKRFLESVRLAFALEPAAAERFASEADAIAATPVVSPAVPEAEIDASILNNAILCAALEQLPQRLATLSILPLQMRMVYRIGKRYGFELDRRHIGDFLAAAGVGMSAQLLDGFARKLVSGLVRHVAGRMLGGLASRATGSAVAFATTYALGHLAKRYYASGRSLSGAQLREAFGELFDRARGEEARHAGDIVRRAGEVNVADLAGLVSTG